jgi:uncharacterized coiled-coil protein SlyX
VAKFINILAASVGGGILLGAGIRLGEAIVGRDPTTTRDPENGGTLEARLGALEDRLVNLEAVRPATSDTSHHRGASRDYGAAGAAAIRSALGREDDLAAALGQIGAQLRVELQGWLAESIGSRMADVEAKLKVESDDARRQMLDAFAESVQTRVTHRISRLEEEVAGQSAAMAELRECSLRTEQSLQKLLGGLDRLLVRGPAPPQADFSSDEEVFGQNGAPAGDFPAQQPVVSAITTGGLEPLGVRESSAHEAPTEPTAAELQPRPRRWSLFG